jgi:putative phage-type endonuclease
VKQGSREWLKARQGKITGSRVGSILGVSKWNKTSDVMREMVREYFDADREFTGNIATRWGNEHEPIAKQDAIIEISNLEGEEVYCLDDGFLTHPAIDWIGASPDGLLGKMRDEEIIYGLEIKCPFSLIIKDHIPQDHICQMQLCMAVYGLSEWWYYQWTPNKTSLMKIERDSSWISDRWEVLNGFILQYNRIIENKTLAEPFLQDLEKEVKTKAWKEAVHNYSAVKIENDLALA